ncbi:MAG: hypothetical protein J6U23_12480 [Clostridiales bacterium]|nr:hypothetical protein [Clostridiales bacterium]MBP5417599.1 hypothetical protein [Clostridiales bacterium]
MSDKESNKATADEIEEVKTVPEDKDSDGGISVRPKKKSFSEMDLKEKLQYFRDYYLIKVLIGLAILLVAGWLIHDIFQNKKIVYSGAGVGVDISDNGAEYLKNGFIDYLGDGYSNKKIGYGGNVLFVPTSGEYNESSVEMAFFSQLEADMFQFLLITEEKYTYFMPYEIFIDLSGLTNFQNYSQKDILYNFTGQPEAIRLSDEMKEKLGVRQQDVYLCFVNKNDHRELNEKMLDFLFS